MSNLTLYRRPVDALGLFDSGLSDFLDGFWNFDHSPAFNPSIEVVESDKEYRLDVEAPGLNRDDIHVEAKEGTLRLWGERKAGKNEKSENCTYSERSYGRFERSFRLPEYVAADKIEAKYNDGILEVRIPKTEQAKPIAIEVKVK